MFKRLLVLLIVFCFNPMLTVAVAPSGQVVLSSSKHLFRPFFNMYIRLKNFVQSDGTQEKSRKVWEIAQKISVVTVIANILLPKCMKSCLGGMPVVGNFVFNGPIFYANVSVAKSPFTA
jgi:hypothetical protein